jgi:hypothetical protein
LERKWSQTGFVVEALTKKREEVIEVEEVRVLL